jgi:hypothetical protein
MEFTNRQSPPVEIESNQKVFIQITLKAKLFQVVPVDCWASSEKEFTSDLLYDLVKNGCPVEDSFKFHDGDDDVERKSQFSFKFQEVQTKQVYLHCKINLCDPTDDDGKCKTDCKKRRSVKHDLKKVSAGPFLVKQSTSNNNPLWIGLVIGAAALGSIITIGAYIFVKRVCPRTRQPEGPIPTSTTTR